MSDRQPDALLQRAQQGDIDAFTELFEPLRRRVYAVAVRLVGLSDAEDVVMDTYLKAWQGIPEFRGRGLKSWLLRIARNASLDRIRYHARRPTVSLDTTVGEEGDAGRGGPSRDVEDDSVDNPVEALLRRETISTVRAALVKLPELYRVSLLLRYADGLSYSEISVATGVSLGTVMSRLHNGKRRLGKLLKSFGG